MLSNGTQAKLYHWLSQGLSTGLPLGVLLQQGQGLHGGELQKAVRALCHAAETTSSLSQAMEMCPELFPENAAAIVASGEHSGRLAAVLLELAQSCEDSNKLQGELNAALRSPSLSLLAVICAFVFACWALETTRLKIKLVSLPFSIDSSAWVAALFWVFAIGIACRLGFSLGKSLLTNAGLFEFFVTKTPAYGTFYQKRRQFEFLKNLRLYLETGRSQAECLWRAARSTGSPKDQSVADDLARYSANGSTLAQSCEKFLRLDSHALAALAQGEFSGQLIPSLFALQERLKNEANESLIRFSTYLVAVWKFLTFLCGIAMVARLFWIFLSGPLQDVMQYMKSI